MQNLPIGDPLDPLVQTTISSTTSSSYGGYSLIFIEGKRPKEVPTTPEKLTHLEKSHPTTLVPDNCPPFSSKSCRRCLSSTSQFMGVFSYLVLFWHNCIFSCSTFLTHDSHSPLSIAQVRFNIHAKMDEVRILMVLYAIWLHRKDKVFNGREASMDGAAYAVEDFVATWSSRPGDRGARCISYLVPWVGHRFLRMIVLFTIKKTSMIKYQAS